MQNAAAQMFGVISRRDHAIPVLSDKTSLSSVLAADYFKNGSSCSQITEWNDSTILFEVVHSSVHSGCIDTKSFDISCDLLFPPATLRQMNSYCRRGFHYAAPKVWNSWLVDVRQDSL